MRIAIRLITFLGLSFGWLASSIAFAAPPATAPAAKAAVGTHRQVKHTEAYKKRGINFCAIAPFPVADKALINDQAEHTIDLVFELSTMIKNGRQSSDLPASLAVPVKLYAKDAATKKILEENTELIAHLAKTSSIEVLLRGESVSDELSVINSSAYVDVVIKLAGLIDIEKETARLKSALEKIQQQKSGLEARLNNEAFVSNAPKAVVDTHKNELAALKDKEEQLRLGLSRLKKA